MVTSTITSVLVMPMFPPDHKVAGVRSVQDVSVAAMGN